jgi:hypothetical protein
VRAGKGGRAGPQRVLESFARDGFVGVLGVLPAAEGDALALHGPAVGASGGTRCLLSTDWCAALARRIREHPDLERLVPPEHVAVQCTYFEKSSARNWLVPVHQDLSIPVAERVDAPGWSGWAHKEGAVFVQAPVEVLEQLVAVRLHLDRCGSRDGPLRVVPGSHTQGVLAPDAAADVRDALGERVCEAEAGAALVMRPLLLHASSKSLGTGRRRVLHLLFGPRSLPHGLRWQTVV